MAPRKKKEKGEFVQTRVPDAIYERLLEIAAKRQSSIASYVRILIYVDLEKDEASLEALKSIGWLN